ncbi:MAG: shikimate kinase [Planctomycetota bacterium]
MPKPRLILLGPRGSGKTTLGRGLVRELRLPFVDTDAEIERAAGRTIAEIFADEGEDGFRDRETDALRGCLARDGILATGGGIVVREENRRLLQSIDAPRVLLLADVGLLAHRITNDPTSTSTRPSLTHHEVGDEVALLLEKRMPWYESVATHTVDTGLDVGHAQAQLHDILSKRSRSEA